MSNQPPQDVEEMVAEAIKKGHFMPEGKKWPMSEQPRKENAAQPQEWRADKDGTLWPLGRYIGEYAKEIADAHNTAVAAEREKVKKLAAIVYKFHQSDCICEWCSLAKVKEAK